MPGPDARSYDRLCTQLLAASDDDAVVAALTASGHWTDSSAWRNFADDENNFSTIGNQQSNPEAALVEKLVNSIDAVLMLHCQLHQIAPESPSAPSSMREAARRFLGVPEGSLANCTATQLTQLAQHVGLIATGTARRLNLTVFDLGEGQTSSTFPETLLSLKKSNKLRIPFVQGKFNMGGTGVFQFCGQQNNLQLIISKRHPELSKDSQWAFTVIRRENPTDGRRSSVYRYLAPGGNVPTIAAASIPLMALDVGRSDPLPTLTHGTIIKLFDYRVAPGTKTNILLDLRNHLSARMTAPAIPVRLYERRAHYRGHTFEANIEGLSHRLARDTRGALEFEPTQHTLPVLDQELSATVYAFKRKAGDSEDSPGRSADEKFRTTEGVIFTVNGQAHGHYDKSFFRRRKVDMSFIADDILVLIDASALQGRAREDLFMNSRDRIRGGELAKEIEQQVERLVSSHDNLRELRARRRAEIVASKLRDDVKLQEILDRLIKKSPALASLFVPGVRLSDPYRQSTAGTGNVTLITRRFPTYFRVLKGSEHGTAEVGRRFRVQFETDAANDYFSREDEPGTYEVEFDGLRYTEKIASNAMNGILTWNMVLPPSAQLGTNLSFKVTVSDPARAQPFELGFQREVIAKTDHKGASSGNRKEPTTPQGTGRALPSGLAMPDVVGVRQPDWSDHGFNRDSALRVLRDEDSTVFVVNLDNVYLATDLKRRTESRGLSEAKFKYGMALFGLAILQAHDRADDPLGDFDAETAAGIYASALAPFLLPMIDGLSDLDEGMFEEYESAMAEDEDGYDAVG